MFIRMKREKKAAYPVFAFRIPQKDKVWLDQELDRLKAIVNRDRAEDEKVINKNDVILEALKLGFIQIRQGKHSKA